MSGREKKDTMTLQVCIHRAADTIGGNCIEIKASTGERLLLDAGRPLETPEGEPTPIPPTLDTTMPVLGVLLSHAHADHFGMLEMLPKDWPVYCGEATETLLRLSAAMGNKSIAQTCIHWKSGRKTAIGPFTITPRLIDHSAFDAYAIQVDVDGKTIVYSGDFRAHGRKAKLTESLIKRPPKQVDALIMEGTNLITAGSAIKPTPTEAELEAQFVNLFKECDGRVFVNWSATNIDRLVTLYRACKRSGRVLVLDLYSMLVLTRLKEFGHIPQPDWEDGHMLTVVTSKMSNCLKRIGVPNFVEELKQKKAAIGAKQLASEPKRWVIMARDSLLNNYAAKGVMPTERDAWVWSMWKGYLEKESSRSMKEFFAPCKKEYIHSSGHAPLGVLRRFAEAMNPKMLVPVHGEAWQSQVEGFPNLRIAKNGEWLKI